MAKIVAFPTDAAPLEEANLIDDMVEDCFLLNEGLELLADFRAIADEEVRVSLRALVKSMARQSSRSSN